MNAYKIISIDDKIVVVEWTINGVATTERLDARYLPTGDATELATELNRLLDGMSKDVPKAIPDEVKALVNVKKDLVAVVEEVIAE